MHPQIRICSLQDCGVLANIIRKSFRDVADRFGLTLENCPKHPSNCTEDWVQQHMNRGATYFALESNAGCVAMKQVSPETFELERLAVLPEQRKHGLGKLLVNHVLSETKRLEARRVNISIIAEYSKLKKWYVKMGFVEGEIKDFAHLPFRVMYLSYNLDR